MVSACGMLSSNGSSEKSNDSSPAANQESSTGTESGQTTSRSPVSLCQNPYYLVEPGKVRKYKLTSQIPGGNREYTLVQKLVDDKTFAEVRTFSSGLVLSVNWDCTDNGLRTVEYVSQAEIKTGSFQMETIGSSGVTIPNTWEQGKQWQTNYKVKAKLDAGPVKTNVNGTVTQDHTLASEAEKVTVPGGTFTAARVDTITKIQLRVKGTAIPTKEVTMSAWYSPQVGIVKQQVHGDFGNEKVEFTGFE